MTWGLSELTVPGSPVGSYDVSFGRLDLLLEFPLHAGDPLSLLPPILYALRFYFALGFSILLLCVQFAVLFCFGLT